MYYYYTKESKLKDFIIRVIILILLIVLWLVIMFFKRVGILIDLKTKLNGNLNKDNYYIKEVIYDGEDIETIEVFKKEDRIANVVKKNDAELKYYSTGNLYIDYIDEDGNTQKVLMNQTDNLENSSFINISNYFKDGSLANLIDSAYNVKIEEVTCNGKECYRLINFHIDELNVTENDSIEDTDLEELYIEKKTGLIIRFITSGSSIKTNYEEEDTDIIVNYYYDFNAVKNRSFKEPNSSEYTKR